MSSDKQSAGYARTGQNPSHNVRGVHPLAQRAAVDAVVADPCHGMTHDEVEHVVAVALAAAEPAIWGDYARQIAEVRRA